MARPAEKKGKSSGKSAKTTPGVAVPARSPSFARAGGENVRRAIAGAPTEQESTRGPESPELLAMREVDRELFAPASPALNSVWPNEWPFPPEYDPKRPAIHASGFAPRPSHLEPVPSVETTHEVGWLRSLAMPELAVRWNARVVRYLEYYHDDPRGRALIVNWIRKSGRYVPAMRKILRTQLVPDDLVWAALVESGFDPTIRSPAGAAGLWQFMPAGAKIYGLVVDRWVDERLDPERATEAAARYLSDLHRRFGGWELALAAYNMGYGGLLASVRKYNTNDYWELAKVEAGLPWETSLYVPKIIAVAVVARNMAAFGIDTQRIEPPIVFDEVFVPGGVSLRTIAAAASVEVADIESLNPQIRAGRTPPSEPGTDGVTWRIRVPLGKASAVNDKLSVLDAFEGKFERYATRQGDSLDVIAASRHTSRARLQEVNALRGDELLRPGTVLLIPAPEAREGAQSALASVSSAEGSTVDKPVVVVPSSPAAVPGRKRVFYRVVAGDTLGEIATALQVGKDDLLRWNAVDPAARLHEGMVLQAFVPPSLDLSHLVHESENTVRVMVRGNEEFLSYFEGLRGRRRLVISAGLGDTWEKLAKRFDLTLGQLERINRRSRTERLQVGDRVVVYAPIDQKVSTSQIATARADLSPFVPMVAPNPEDLPAVPESTLSPGSTGLGEAARRGASSGHIDSTRRPAADVARARVNGR